MSNQATRMLEQNRLVGVMEDIEADRPVDVGKVAILQSFDLVRAGQLFVADAMKREDQIDEQFAAGFS